MTAYILEHPGLTINRLVKGAIAPGYHYAIMMDEIPERRESGDCPHHNGRYVAENVLIASTRIKPVRAAGAGWRLTTTPCIAENK